jgi:hypothetical protein
MEAPGTFLVFRIFKLLRWQESYSKKEKNGGAWYFSNCQIVWFSSYSKIPSTQILSKSLKQRCLIFQTHSTFQPFSTDICVKGHLTTNKLQNFHILISSIQNLYCTNNHKWMARLNNPNPIHILKRFEQNENLHFMWKMTSSISAKFIWGKLITLWSVWRLNFLWFSDQMCTLLMIIRFSKTLWFTLKWCLGLSRKGKLFQFPSNSNFNIYDKKK